MLVKYETEQAHKWNTADTITSVRIVASLFLLFPPLRSAWFLVVYTLTGLTDALDGWLPMPQQQSSIIGLSPCTLGLTN